MTTRHLPEWLANPHLIENDLSTYSGIEDSIKGIDAVLLNNLAQMGIHNLFPVQHHVVPIILNGARFGVGPCNYSPNDICVSAPTGSGKTLAFAMPIVQCLLNRVVQETRALILLPTRELASQVSEVFNYLCKGTELTSVLLCGGVTTVRQEQQQLFSYRNGQKFQADIIVATPGRLVEHIMNSSGLSLDYLRFLVLDEADRMLTQIKNNWLELVESMVYKNRNRSRKVSVKTINQPVVPLQKLLFSATLSGDPEKLELLNLFYPRLFTAHFIPNQTNQPHVQRYVTPALLKEYMIVVHSKHKPLAVLDILRNLDNKVLCFTGTIENTTRLAHLIRLFAKEYGFKDFSCVEFSSQMDGKNRNMVMQRFKNGLINVLVSSDSMARGIDVPDIETVILYDVPINFETYIHRVGRTARAGKRGTAYTILLPSEAHGFKEMLKDAGKSIPKKRVSNVAYKELLPVYTKVLPSLGKIMKKKS